MQKNRKSIATVIPSLIATHFCQVICHVILASWDVGTSKLLVAFENSPDFKTLLESRPVSLHGWPQIRAPIYQWLAIRIEYTVVYVKCQSLLHGLQECLSFSHNSTASSYRSRTVFEKWWILINQIANASFPVLLPWTIHKDFMPYPFPKKSLTRCISHVPDLTQSGGLSYLSFKGYGFQVVLKFMNCRLRTWVCLIVSAPPQGPNRQDMDFQFTQS